MQNYKSLTILTKNIALSFWQVCFKQKISNLLFHHYNTKELNVAKLIIVDESKSETAQTAYAVSRAFLESNCEELDNLLHKQFTYTGDGYHFSKDENIAFMQDMRGAFSNFEMILDKTITKNIFTSIRFTSKVVNTGSFMGAPANQKNLTVTGIFQRKFENGEIVQE